MCGNSVVSVKTQNRPSYTYDYRFDGNQISKINFNKDNIRFDYDDLGQLKSENAMHSGRLAPNTEYYSYDTRSILNRGTEQEVRDHVKRNIEILAPGGFVFNTVHNIMPDVPPQNIVAMFETVESYK